MTTFITLREDWKARIDAHASDLDVDDLLGYMALDFFGQASATMSPIDAMMHTIGFVCMAAKVDPALAD